MTIHRNFLFCRFYRKYQQ